MALGMAGVTTVWAVVDSLLLRPLPFLGAERMHVLWSKEKSGGQVLSSPARLLDFHRESKNWEAISGFYGENMNLVAVAGKALEAPLRLSAVRMLPGFGKAVGLQPQFGRLPEAQEENYGGPKRVVVSDEFWRSHLGADRGVLGKTLQLNGETYEVVGVAPPDFRFPSARTQLFVPAQFHPGLISFRGAQFLVGVGLRKAGASETAAKLELEQIAGAHGRKFGGAEKDLGVAFEEVRTYLVGSPAKQTLGLMAGAVLLLLVTAVLNAASLFLARGIERQREYAVKLALGGSPLRILLEVVGEGLRLSALAFGLACLLGWWGLDFLSGVWKQMPSFREPAMDWRVMLAALAIATFVGLICSLAPAIDATRQDAAGSLRRVSRTGGGRWSMGWRQGMVGLQVALGFVLLAGTMALGQSFSRLNETDAGFAKSGLLFFEVTLPWETDPVKRVQFFQLAKEKLKESALVGQVAVAERRPLDSLTPIEVWTAPRGPKNRIVLDNLRVSEEYFGTLRIPILEGRGFLQQDHSAGERAVVLSKAAAERLFPGKRAVGELMFRQWGEEARALRIVGIAANTKVNLRGGAAAIWYELPREDQWPSSVFIVKAKAGLGTAATEPLLADMRRKLREVAPGQALHGVSTMEEYWASKVAEPRMNFLFVGLFGSVATLLAAIGLFGGLAWFVAQQKVEIGVRLALGAQVGRIFTLVGKQALLPLAVGATIGMVAASTVLEKGKNFLYEADRFAWDPIAAAGLFILLMAALAMAAPAWRAARINPQAALREQ